MKKSYTRQAPRKIKTQIIKTARGAGIYRNYNLSIPASIAECIPAHIRFRPELTDEGILFRPVLKKERKMVAPSWATDSAEVGA
jgi:hypothetical protein